MLTAVLVLIGSYHLVLVIRSRPFVERVNNGLHALMNAVMAAMLWDHARSTMLAQIAALAAASLWFAIQGAARPEFKALCAGRRGRLKCAYHSLTMAAGALMIATMGHVTAAGRGTATAPGASHAHHMTATAQASTAGPSDYSAVLTMLPSSFFGAAAILFIILLIRSGTSVATARHARAVGLRNRAVLGIEALGAAAMALMFASLAA